MGELTITRYMDGQLPSKKYSDYLYEILNDEQKMKSIVKKIILLFQIKQYIK